ncbi:MAG: Holliday junction resolvase RecU [Coprobacillus cateniformis]
MLTFEAKRNKSKDISIWKHLSTSNGSFAKNHQSWWNCFYYLLHLQSLNEVYLIDASHVICDYYHSHRKSMTYDRIKTLGHIIPQGYQPRLDYLNVIDEVYFKEDE